MKVALKIYLPVLIAALVSLISCELPTSEKESAKEEILSGNLAQKTRLWVNTGLDDAVIQDNVVDGTNIIVRTKRVAFKESLGDGMIKMRARLKLTNADWAGLVLRRINVTGIEGWSSQGYLLMFYPNGNVALQKLVKHPDNPDWVDFGSSAILADLSADPPALALDGSVEYLIEYGTLNTSEGVRLLLKINGTKYIDMVDASAPLSASGYFAAAMNGGTPAGNALTISSLEWTAFDAAGTAPQPPADPDLTSSPTLWNVPANSSSGFAGGTLSVTSNSPVTLKAADGDVLYTVTGTIAFDAVEDQPVVVRLRRQGYDETNDDWWHQAGYILRLWKAGGIQLIQGNTFIDLASSAGAFNDGEEHSFTFGVRTEATGVRVVMAVDGTEAINHLDDTAERVEDDGRLAFAQMANGVNTFTVVSVTKEAYPSN